MWDVTTPAAQVEATGSSTAIWTDLMTGTTYGTGTVTAAQVNQVVSIPLLAAAATDVKATLGNDFVVGLHLDNAPPGYVRFSGASEARVARLVVTYQP